MLRDGAIRECDQVPGIRTNSCRVEQSVGQSHAMNSQDQNRLDRMEFHSFPVVVNELLTWIREDFPHLSWSSIVVVENTSGSGAKLTPPVTDDSFDSRFQQILDLGYRDWVNVGAISLVDDVLTIEVLYMTTPLSERAEMRFSRDEIWVNLHTATRGALFRTGGPGNLSPL